MTEDIAAKIKAFFATYHLLSYPKGQILIMSGDDSNTIYFLVKGSVKQYDVTYRGNEVILNIFKPLAFFPMSLAINKAPNSYVYEVNTPAQIRQAPAT